VPLDAAHLFQNRDYPVLNEYRSFLGGLMARQFSLSTHQMDQVFPGVSAHDYGFALTGMSHFGMVSFI
jgi:hypothetical protein